MGRKITFLVFHTKNAEISSTFSERSRKITSSTFNERSRKINFRNVPWKLSVNCFFRSSNHLFNVRRYPKKCTFSKHTWKHAFPIIPCPKKMHRECNRFICDAGRRTHTIYSNRYHPYYSKQSISHFPSFFFIQSTAHHINTSTVFIKYAIQTTLHKRGLF